MKACTPMLIINLVLTVLLVVFCSWAYTRLPVPPPPPKNPPPPPRIPCGIDEAKEYQARLKQLAEQEQWKADNLDGRAAERAEWLCAKARYALHRSREAVSLEDAGVRNLLEDTWLLLLRGRNQNDSGAEDMCEEGGGRLRTYHSPVDGTVQTYSVSVPGIYDPAVKWPLLVSMHGHGWYNPFQGHPAPNHSGVICLSPQGRGSTDYKDLGEDDVLAAIAEVKREFNIDPDRVYLTGGSMGGTGSFHLGVHYADQFAGICPVVGNADNLAWTERWGWNREFPGRNTELRLFVQEGHTSRAFACNLRNLPTFILAGAADTIVPPAHSRNTVQELRRLGIPVEYREYPGIGHGGFSWETQSAALAWTMGWKREPFPRHITWKADLLKHGKAYWMRFEQLDAPMASGEIDVWAFDGNRVEVTTTNLRAFSLQKPAALFDESANWTVVIDDEELVLPASSADLPHAWHTFRRHEGTGKWMQEKDMEMPKLAKCRGCEGPVHEAFMAPFVLVVGTRNDKMNDVWLAEAEQFARDWKIKNAGFPRVVFDRDVTEDMEMQYNLILFGGAEDNIVAERLLPDTPLRELKALTSFQGGSNVPNLEAPDVGVIMTYPNVSVSSRQTVFIMANGPEAAYRAWGRFGNWFNWGVFDSKKYFDFAIYDKRSSSPETMLLVGWFGTDWSVKRATYFFGSDTVREESADQQYPRLAAITDDAPALLELANLRPARIDQMRGTPGWGRTFFGEPLPGGGIGLRAPAVLEYDINGAYATFESGVRLLNPRETSLCKQRLDGEIIRFTLFGDKDRKLAEVKLDWKTPEGKFEKVNITGVKRLKLEVAPAGGPAWLHAGSAWIRPILQK